MDSSDADSAYAKEVGARLFQARQQAGVGTQTEVSIHLGLGVNTVGMWERGLVMPRADNLAAVCRLYNVSTDWILGLSQTPKVGGIGGVLNLAAERAVLGATSWSQVEESARRLGVLKAPAIVFGYQVPSEFEVVGDAEWKLRSAAITLKLRRLVDDAGAPRADGKRK